MTRYAKRVQTAEQVHEESRRLHVIWAEWDDTEADLEVKRERMVADGKASPGDKFVYVGWKAPQDT